MCSRNYFSRPKCIAFYDLHFVGGERKMREAEGFDAPWNTQLITILRWDSNPHLFIS